MEQKRKSIEDKLFINKFNVDLNKPHISISNKKLCKLCNEKPCLYVCPVENYKKINGTVELTWEGCLECGACRLSCPKNAVSWEYPSGGFGISYRFG